MPRCLLVTLPLYSNALFFTLHITLRFPFPMRRQKSLMHFKLSSTVQNKLFCTSRNYQFYQGAEGIGIQEYEREIGRLKLIPCRGIYWRTYVCKSPSRKHTFQSYWLSSFLQNCSSTLTWPAKSLLEISYF